MDTEALVDNLIEDGRTLVEDLPRLGFEVAAAFWIKTTESSKWYFYLVSPAVDAEGITPAYKLLHLQIRAMPQPLWIDPLKIRLIGPSNPMARDVLAVLERTRGTPGRPIRWRGISLGNTNVDGAYLYPLPAHTAK